MLTSPFSPPRITPPAEHPRVMLRRRDFDRIRRNLTLPECAREAALWEKLCGMDFADFDDIIENGVYHSLVCLILEAKALKALLNDDRTLSRDMIAMALRLSGRYNPESDWLMKARFGGHIVYVCAVCYDWLYPYFTEEEKNKLIENCESILYATLETGYPPLKQSPISSHGTEAQLLRDCMSFAIAVYDQRPDIYDFCAGRVFDEYVPTYKMFYGGRFQLQGPAYGGYRYCFSAWCQLLFEAMSGEKIFDSNMENMCESLLYLLRPDGEYMRLGNDFNESKGKNSYTNRAPATVPMFYAGAMTGKSCYRDYYFQNYHEKFLLPDKYGRDYYSDGSFSESMLSPTAFLVFNRFTEPVETPPLPAAQYFGSPAGVTLYKKDDTLLLMKIGEVYTTGHDHYDCGHFEIYHKGILASDSGYYDWFGCEHHYNYAARTYAHNCVTVSDPAKIGTTIDFWRRPDAVYDGGQLVIRGAWDVPDLATLEREYRRGVVLSHTETEDLVEITGDLTVPYSESCDRYIRSMRFLPNEGERGIFTVRDEITAKEENFIKQFHVHCQTEPTLLGDRQFLIQNGGGKLLCTVLEPADCTIEFIGGPDNEFSLNGVNHPREQKSLNGGENENGHFIDEAGWGRITITANAKQKSDTFLVQFTICDGDSIA